MMGQTKTAMEVTDTQVLNIEPTRYDFISLFAIWERINEKQTDNSMRARIDQLEYCL